MDLEVRMLKVRPTVRVTVRAVSRSPDRDWSMVVRYMLCGCHTGLISTCWAHIVSLRRKEVLVMSVCNRSAKGEDATTANRDFPLPRE